MQSERKTSIDFIKGRVEENSSVKGQSSRELSMIRAELRRRKSPTLIS